jgi:hypothetical protein
MTPSHQAARAVLTGAALWLVAGVSPATAGELIDEDGPIEETPLLGEISDLDDLTDEEKHAVAQLADDPAAPLPPGWPAPRLLRVLDAATEVVGGKLGRGLPFDHQGEGLRRRQQLQRRRAGVAAIAGLFVAPQPMWQRPEVGHGWRRVGVLGGATRGTPSIYLDARVALHDLADPAAGYPQASSLEILPTRARVFFEGDRPRISLEHAYLVRASSLPASNGPDGRLAWRLQVGAVNVDDSGCSEERCLIAQAVVGAGLAVESQEQRFLGWAMIDAQIASGPHLQGPNDIPLRLATAPTLGLRIRMDEDLHALLGASLWVLPWQSPDYLAQGSLELRWLVTAPFAIAAEGRLEADLGANTTSARAQLGAYVYF